MPRRKKPDLAAILQNDISRIMDLDDGDAKDNRAKAWDYYQGRATGMLAPQPGRSQVISMDVADMTEAVLAQMIPAITNDNPALFEPSGPDDVEQAQMESDAVSYAIMELNRGFTHLYNSIKDTLLFRNGTIKCWVETKTDVELATFEPDGLDGDAVAAQVAAELMQEPGVTVEILEPTADGDIQLRITTETRQLKLQAIQQDMMVMDPNHDSIFLDDVVVMGERRFDTRSDLLEMGFNRKLVNDLPATTLDTDEDSSAKRTDNGSQISNDGPRDTDLIESYEMYRLIDMDGDGISELHKVFYSNSQVLDDQVVLYRPYASGCCLMVPHRYAGISLFDKLEQIQNQKTAVLRQRVDNLVQNNYVRLVVVGSQVDPDDLTNPRVSGVIKAKSVDAVRPLPVQDTGQSSQAMLDYLDKMRSERGGASLDMQTAEAQIVGNTATGIAMQMTSREMLAGMMTRTISETLIRSLFILVHNVMRLDYAMPMTLRRGDEWVEVNPEEWGPRDRVNVALGQSPGERRQRVQALGSIVNEQKELIAAGYGGILADEQTYYQAQTDLMAAAEIDNGQKYFIDPDSDKSKQAAQNKAQQAQAQAQEQKQLQQIQLQMAEQGLQLQAQEQQGKQIMDALELQFKYFDAVLDSETRSAIADGKTTGQLETLQNQGSEQGGTNQGTQGG